MQQSRLPLTHKHDFTLLRVNIALLNYVTVFRIDLSSNLAIITKEDPKEPALRCDNGTAIYNSYREDLLLTFEQGDKLPDVEIPSRLELTADRLQKLLGDLGFNSIELTDDELKQIITMALGQENPYA